MMGGVYGIWHHLFIHVALVREKGISIVVFQDIPIVLHQKKKKNTQRKYLSMKNKSFGKIVCTLATFLFLYLCNLSVSGKATTHMSILNNYIIKQALSIFF